MSSVFVWLLPTLMLPTHSPLVMLCRSAAAPDIHRRIVKLDTMLSFTSLKFIPADFCDLLKYISELGVLIQINE